jgi:hypothetical protein
MDDRFNAKGRRTFVESEVKRRIDDNQIAKFHPLTTDEADDLNKSFKDNVVMLPKSKMVVGA